MKPSIFGQVLHVMDALAAAAEEAVRTLFRDIPARGDQPGIGKDAPHQVDELIFVAPGAVQGQDHRAALPSLVAMAVMGGVCHGRFP
ncbi:hypothetical protein [Paracoccus binzhouensis]|uniref:hypothetical protein n=1 Tax=Paracoccus binzhouensis TaxID=2796149 RepID=UPI002FCDFF3A